jgi:Ca2+-binding EF-hand superfamily protein
MLLAYALHLFHLCDQDRLGTLQVEELVDIMCKVGHPASMEQAQNIMSKADLDCSGVLESEEFL